MKLLYTLALLSGFASCASISTIRRDYGGLDPSQIVLHGVVAGGSGCDGTSTITGMLSPDGQTVTVTIDTAGLMKAAYGPGVSILQLSKFCQINLSLSYPVGYQYSLDPSGLRGSLSLDFNVTSRVQQKVYFSGQGDQITRSNEFTGPVYSERYNTGNYSDASSFWSPCLGSGSSLANVVNEVAIAKVGTAKDARGTMTVDNPLVQTIKLSWRQC